MSPYRWIISLSEGSSYVAYVWTLFVQLVARMDDSHGGIELMKWDRQEAG